MWALAARQHGVVTRQQLLALGLHPQAIKHRGARGRLHLVRRGIYAVGRPELSQRGRWVADVLACGDRAGLSHCSASALFGIWKELPAHRHVSVTSSFVQRPSGISVHRRSELSGDELTERDGIPVTSPALTLVDLAACLRGQIEAAINEADKLDLIDPEALREAINSMPKRPGIAAVRRVLDRRTFVLTHSELERRFLPIARSAGLPLPQTQVVVNGFRVDFFWAELGLVVETDGLRYHRTPAQQAKDRVRDHAHLAGGVTPLRFTHAQIRWEPGYVRATLASVAGRLRDPSGIGRG